MLPEFIHGRLAPLPTTVPSLTLWQHRSLLADRGVIYWDASSVPCTISWIHQQARNVVREHFGPFVWRNLGFGMIVTLDEIDNSLDLVEHLVDLRANRAGTWQWLVLHIPSARTAIGVRSWMDGSLAPVYRDLLSALQHRGFDCNSCTKESDSLLTKKHHVPRQLKPILAAVELLSAIMG